MYIGSARKEGTWGKFYCPITNLQHHLLAILYVNDTNLLHIDLTKDKSIDEVHDAIQISVNSLGNLLIATGGVLQPSKCFYSIISFEWDNGLWKYAKNSLKGELGITVLLPGGSEAAIDHKSINHAEKNSRSYDLTGQE
jgi:hypothetical protein